MRAYLARQVADIRKLNTSGRFRTHVFAGVECDILADGRLDYDDATLATLDYVVASVHKVEGLPLNCMVAVADCVTALCLKGPWPRLRIFIGMAMSCGPTRIHNSAF